MNHCSAIRLSVYALIAGTTAPLLAQPIDLLFAEPAYEISRTPTPVATMVHGDFNNDGFVDLAWISDPVVGARADLGTSITVVLGEGNGFFHESHIIPAAASEIIAADLNNDGFDDLVCNSGGITIHLSQGDGTFEAPSAEASSTPPTTLLAHDFDQDGFPEIVYDSRVLTRTETDGYLTFITTQVTVPLLPRFKPFVIDLDSDGTPEVIFDAGTQLGVGIARENGAIDSQFVSLLVRPEISTATFSNLVAFPFPNSSELLIAASRTGNSFRPYQTTLELVEGRPEFTQQQSFGSTFFASFTRFNELSTTFVDLDADGRVDRIDQLEGDVYFSRFDNQRSSPVRLLNRFELGFGAPSNRNDDLNIIGNRQLFIDVTNDGVPEVVRPGRTSLATRDLESSLPNFDIRFASNDLLAGPPIVADFDGDTLPDLFNPSGASIARSTQQTGTRANPSITNQSIPNLIRTPNNRNGALGDLNSDGNLDVVVSYDLGTRIVTYTNTGDGSFTSELQRLGTVDAFGSTDSLLADLDGDQDLDLIHMVNISGWFGDTVIRDRLEILRNDNGVFTESFRLELGQAGRFDSSTLFDSDADGLLDLFTIFVPVAQTQLSQQELLRLPGLPDGTFGEPQPFDSSALGLDGTITSIRVADLNADGSQEVLLQYTDIFDQSFAGLVLLSTTPAGTLDLANPQIITTKADFESPFLFDINTDGLLDISTEAGGAFIQQPDGTFRNYDLRQGLPFDVNGDGRPDLVQENFLNQSVAFYPQAPLAYGSCRSDLNADGFLTTADLAVFVEAFLAGNDDLADTNRDGLLDLGDIAEFVQRFTAGC